MCHVSVSQRLLSSAVVLRQLETADGTAYVTHCSAEEALGGSYDCRCVDQDLPIKHRLVKLNLMSRLRSACREITLTFLDSRCYINASDVVCCVRDLAC